MDRPRTTITRTVHLPVTQSTSGSYRLPTPDEAWDRAAQVQGLLVESGNWRALSVADLVIAAVAERQHAVVLHYDGDYDMIAAVTGQPTRWVVPAGTAD